MKQKLVLLLLCALLCTACTVQVEESYSRLPDETNAAGGDAQVNNDRLVVPGSSQSSAQEEPSSQPEESSSAAESSSAESISSASSSAPVAATGEQSDDWRLILVNDTHVLQKEYDVELEHVTGGFYFDQRAAGELNRMLADAKAAGIDLQIISTYRSFARSEQNFERKKQELMATGMSEEDAAVETAKWIAPPGQSEHNTGLAIDVVSPGYWNQYADLLPEFEEDPAFAWLYSHCADYGFILRFPKDKESITNIVYEPWHYRYVGVEHARTIMEQKICLEEYLGQA